MENLRQSVAKRLLWFIALWIMGVAAVATVATIIRLTLSL
jgi:hypothetical protein